VKGLMLRIKPFGASQPNRTSPKETPATPTTFLSELDGLAEREGFEPSIQVLARITV
jgi:hypothetical protein